jgi:hypothetical protein
MIESIRPMVIRDPNSNSTLKNILHASNSGFFLRAIVLFVSADILCSLMFLAVAASV